MNEELAYSTQFMRNAAIQGISVIMAERILDVKAPKLVHKQ